MSTSFSVRAPLSPLEFEPSALRSADRLQSIRSSLGNLALQIVPACDVPERTLSATVATGVRTVDELTGGIPRGALTELCGPASSGRTSLLLSLLASMTRAGEVCALVDASDSFSPHAASDAGVDLRQLLWVRCNGKQPQKEKQPARYVANDFAGHDYIGPRTNPAAETLAAKANPFATILSRETAHERILRSAAFRRIEQALKVTDLLLQGGGFGLIVIDLGDTAPNIARRVPLTSWFRFRRTVENTPTALLVLEQEPYARTCASLVLRARRTDARRSSLSPNAPAHARLLRGIDVAVEVERTQSMNNKHIGKKPPRSVRADFAAEAKWEKPLASGQ